MKYEWEEKIKPTKQRMMVYEILAQANRPLSANEIFDEIKISDESIWLSTIYRALDVFVANNVFIKYDIFLEKTNLSVYRLNDGRHMHYAICSKCNKLISIFNCAFENYRPELEENDFLITSHKIEIYGICKNCQ